MCSRTCRASFAGFRTGTHCRRHRLTPRRSVAVAGRPRPTCCFECGTAFPTPDLIFSEDQFENGYCEDCTLTMWGGRENFKDVTVERVQNLAGSILKIDVPSPIYEE